jgi:glutathione S-transferase
MPVVELPGLGAIAHSSAILLYVGRKYDLHPRDAFEAARHERMM